MQDIEFIIESIVFKESVQQWKQFFWKVNMVE